MNDPLPSRKPFREKLHGAGMQSRVLIGYPFALLYLVFARPHSLGLFVAAAVLVFLGCSLRAWAAGYLEKGKRVAVGGPYAFVRNPLYLGSAIIAAGCGLALIGAPIPWAARVLGGGFLLAFAIIYPSKIKAEEKELVLVLNGPYQNYARKVPSFFPWKGRVPGLGHQTFSLKTYFANREYQCLLGSSGIVLFLFVRYHFGI